VFGGGDAEKAKTPFRVGYAARVDETIQRNIVITSVAPSVRFTVQEPKSSDPDIA
jgi:hypothetical protein